MGAKAGKRAFPPQMQEGGRDGEGLGDSLGENLKEYASYSFVLTGAEIKTEKPEEGSRLAQPQREPSRDGQKDWQAPLIV